MNITKHYPVDENAFSVYGCGTRVGQQRPNSQSQFRARCYAKQKVIKSLLNDGTLEQQRLVLLHVLLDRKVSDIASSIGVNMALIQICQQLLWCAKKLIVRATDTENRNFIVHLGTVYVSTKLVAPVLLTPLLETQLPCYLSLK
jgi:hypothetical protein